MRTSLCLMTVLLGLLLTACTSKQNADANVPPVPVPEKVTTEEKPQTLTTYTEDSGGQYVTVHLPNNNGEKARTNEPKELASLLEMQGTQKKEEGAVALLRPNAIREAAQLVAFQTAIEYRYKELLGATEKHTAIMDTAFNFAPLLMTHEDALIMPPVLTKAGASMRLEEANTATTAKTTYELLEPARYVAIAPNWRHYLMVDAFPKAEQPNPAVLPKNAEERAIWRTAVREAWVQGQSEADQLYEDNIARMVREYRGVMLYHLLTAQELLSRVGTATADLGMHMSDKGKKLHIGQKVYRITAPSAFIPMKNGK